MSGACTSPLRAGPSVESKDVSRVDESLLNEVEADVYWCLTKLLDNIQVGGVPVIGGNSRVLTVFCGR